MPSPGDGSARAEVAEELAASARCLRRMREVLRERREEVDPRLRRLLDAVACEAWALYLNLVSAGGALDDLARETHPETVGQNFGRE